MAHVGCHLTFGSDHPLDPGRKIVEGLGDIPNLVITFNIQPLLKGPKFKLIHRIIDFAKRSNNIEISHDYRNRREENRVRICK